MKTFWRIYTLIDLLVVIIILATGFADNLIGKILLAVFAALSVSGLMKVVDRRNDEE